MLKGTTKIELTDVNTGETQVIEKHNAITGAMQEIFSLIEIYQNYITSGAVLFVGKKQQDLSSVQENSSGRKVTQSTQQLKKQLSKQKRCLTFMPTSVRNIWQFLL